MQCTFVRTSVLFCVILATLGFQSATCAQWNDWPQFRGVKAQGFAENQDLPETWDGESHENILWKVPVDGLGLSSPIVSGDHVFIVTAVGTQDDPSLKVGLYGNIDSVDDEGPQSWQLYCLNKSNGAIEWIRQLHYGEPAIKRHTKASHANSTPATDGRHVVVMLGSEGLHCFDVNGNRLWKKELGHLDSGFYMAKGAQWGFGSSPIIHQGRVIVQCDVQDDSFLAAFDVHSGDEIWRVERDDVPSWGTPAIHEGARTQVVVNGYGHSGGYDFWTGNEIWKLGWGGDIPVPTPVMWNNLIILSSAHGLLRPLRAVKASAEGTVSPTSATSKFLAWNKPRSGIYMQTPLVYDDLLYACTDSGVLSCYEVESGERLYKKRLGGGGFTASAVAADGKLYFTSEKGVIYVVRAGREYELLSKNDMDEVCMATPAISSKMMIIRGQEHVFAVGKAANQRGAPIGLVNAIWERMIPETAALTGFVVDGCASTQLPASATYVPNVKTRTCRTSACTRRVSYGDTRKRRCCIRRRR